MTEVNNTPEQATAMIEAQLKRRFDLIENVEFRKVAIELCKKLGVTASEWNENKADILLFFANEYCGIENKEGLNGRFTA